MAYRAEKTKDGSSLVIDGFENGIASSPYSGIANIRNLNTSYYPGVAYVNYRRQLSSLNDGNFFAGAHSIDVSNNNGWIFTAPSIQSMGNPVSKAVSPSGLIYIQDDQGNIFKQNAVNGTVFSLIQDGGGRIAQGASGIAWWNNYLVVFGGGVIEFCGDGTGDAGITSANWNLNGGTGFGTNGFTFTVTTGSSTVDIVLDSPYTAEGTPRLQVGDTVTFTTTGTLPAPLVVGTTYVVAQNNNNGSGYRFSTSFSNANQAVGNLSGISIGATAGSLQTAWQRTTGTYTVLFNDGSNSEFRTTTLTNGSANFTWTGGLSNAYAYLSKISILITFTTNGTGVQTVTDTSNPLPLGNATSVNLLFLGSFPFTSLSLNSGTGGSFGSYVNPTGVTVTGIWLGASGLYNIIMKNGQKIPANFVNGSSSINLLSSLNYIGYGTDWSLQLLDPTVTNYKPYVSKVDGSLLFSNGQFVGRISENSDPNVLFNPSLANTYTVSFGVTSIPEQYTDTTNGMVDLKSQLVVFGQRDTYVWDYVSASTSSPSPVGEQIIDGVNLLNNIYILAGQKGNLYVSNGYSSQLLYKLPDFIAGVIDPVWSFGGTMIHRSKLFFQALAKKTDGTNILAGIFSVIVSPSAIGETTQGLVMENQNSYGLTPASGATGAGILIDNSPSSTGYDSYYSAWSNGASTGGIDYNDTSLWQNFEPIIETDLIPIASILEKKTLGNMEFKLDRQMTTGDSIRLSWRGSLTDVYSTPISFTGAILSDYHQSDISQLQWVQFKAEFDCASSGSSFIPLREIRIHYN